MPVITDNVRAGTSACNYTPQTYSQSGAAMHPSPHCPSTRPPVHLLRSIQRQTSLGECDPSVDRGQEGRAPSPGPPIAARHVRRARFGEPEINAESGKCGLGECVCVRRCSWGGIYAKGDDGPRYSAVLSSCASLSHINCHHLLPMTSNCSPQYPRMAKVLKPSSLTAKWTLPSQPIVPPSGVAPPMSLWIVANIPMSETCRGEE